MEQRNLLSCSGLCMNILILTTTVEMLHRTTVLLFDFLIREIPISPPCLWLADELSRAEREGGMGGPIIPFPHKKAYDDSIS